MPIPGLTGANEFSNWMKIDYARAGRPAMSVRPEHGGLLTVIFTSKYHAEKTLDQAIAEAEEMP
jgi:hypothetical protein